MEDHNINAKINQNTKNDIKIQKNNEETKDINSGDQ